MRFCGSSAALLAVLGIASSASAQSVVRGIIRIDSTAHPIPGATALVEVPGAVPATTDPDGRFVLGNLLAGRVSLSFRAVGFRPLQVVADLSGTDTLELDVLLTPLAQSLAPLAVTARGPPTSGKMLEFERRRASGFGHFFTRADLDKREAYRLSTLLREVGGVQLVPLPTGCSGLAIASTRARNVPIPPSMWCYDNPPRPVCYLDIYLDGSRFWRFGQGPPPEVDQFAVREFQGVEVYRGRSELPIELSRGEPDCGAIVLWTRTGLP